MMFAHTAVELPKYGASRRDAAISSATGGAGVGRADIARSTLRRPGRSGRCLRRVGLVRSRRVRPRRPGGRVGQNEREIGLRIAAARRERGLTQAEFAKLVGGTSR